MIESKKILIDCPVCGVECSASLIKTDEANNYNKLLEFVKSLAEQKDSIFPSEAPQDARELLKEIEENK